MAPIRILRFSRSDGDDASSFVLVQALSTGARPLDLKLIGTEGEAPYAVTLRHDRVSALLSKSAPCTPAEWEGILTSLVRQEPVQDIQATAAVQSESTITISVRKRVQGITQRLGSITLTHHENEAIELFDWCAIACDDTAKGQKFLAEVATKTQLLEKEVTDLKAQLDELIKAKQEDEAALLHRFRDLLNEKKVKIREQQRIIASSTVDDQKLAEVHASQTSNEKGHTARPSRATKRKEPVKDESSDDGFERMEVDEPVTAPLEDDEDQQTTEESETASEADDDEPVRPSHRKAAATSSRAESTRQAADTPAADLQQQAKPEAKPPLQLPPPRQLPFALQKKAAKIPPRPAASAATEGSETESDDEL